MNNVIIFGRTVICVDNDEVNIGNITTLCDLTILNPSVIKYYRAHHICDNTDIFYVLDYNGGDEVVCLFIDKKKIQICNMDDIILIDEISYDRFVNEMPSRLNRVLGIDNRIIISEMGAFYIPFKVTDNKVAFNDSKFVDFYISSIKNLSRIQSVFIERGDYYYGYSQDIPTFVGYKASITIYNKANYIINNTKENLDYIADL